MAVKKHSRAEQHTEPAADAPREEAPAPAAPAGEPIPPNHPDRIILEAERALLAVAALMEGPDTGNTAKECTDAAKLMKRMFRERPRTAMGAAAIIRTFCNPHIGLDAATITNDGSDLMALQGVLGLLEMLPIEAAYESPVLGRFLSLGEGLVMALGKVRDRLSGLAEGVGSDQLRDLAGELDRVTSELAALWRKEWAHYEVILGRTPTEALFMGVRRPGVRSPAERAAEKALAEVENMKARMVPMRVTDLADSLGCLVDAANALEAAIEGLAGGSPDAREVGVHALGRHVAAMAETLCAAVGGREPRGEPDGSRLNTAHWLCPDFDEQEDGRSVSAVRAAEAEA